MISFSSTAVDHGLYPSKYNSSLYKAPDQVFFFHQLRFNIYKEFIEAVSDIIHI